MRQASRAKARARQQVSVLKSNPAPVGGLNAYDSIADMKPIDALVLDNWYPRSSYVEIRSGHTSHATGMTGNGKTLMVYNGLNGNSTLYCSTATGVYDVSNIGAVGASKAARTDGKHQWVMFGDGTSEWLIMVNGVDAPLYFDGTTWTAVTAVSSPALTGVTATELINVTEHKGRLFFARKNTLEAWYLAAGVAGGALTKFDLSGVAKKGGFLLAIEPWTVDAGSGVDDRLVFITSEGELIVYAGTNPSSSSSWSLVGVYEVARPIGYKCAVKISGDVVVITQTGLFSLTTSINDSGVNYNNAVSKKIEKLFNEATLIYGGNFGWRAILHPAQSALIINVPVAEDGEHIQYVMNTVTKAWGRFLEWDAEDFADFDGNLYFCKGTAVYRAWNGKSDLGADIVAYGKTAFSYFGNNSQSKHFKMFRPVLTVNGSLSYLTDIDLDFEDKEITGIATYTNNSSAVWDTSNWDESYWTGGLQVVKDWSTPSEWTGFSAAGKLKIATSTLTIQWLSTDYLYETGGIL